MTITDPAPNRPIARPHPERKSALPERRVAFRTDTSVDLGADAAVVEHRWGRTRLGHPSPGVRRGLAALATYQSVATLAEHVGDGLAPTDPRTLIDLARIHTLIGSRPALMRTAVCRDGAPVVEVVAMSDRAEAPAPGLLPPGSRVELPRHAYLRRLPDPSNGLVLESPLSLYRAEWHDRDAVSSVTGLAWPGCGPLPPPADDGSPSDPPTVERLVLELLVAVGLLSAPPAGGEPATLAMWDFHDLLFHSRSRLGRHDYPHGGLFRHQGLRPPLPAVKAPPPGPAIDLAIPSWGDTVKSDPCLSEALEARRSIRAYGAEPVTCDQLAELLYRSTRVRRVAHVSAVAPYDACDRVAPTGGGAADLEVYVTVARCRGLEAGIYHYDAAGHRLRPLAHTEEDRHRLLFAAWQATAGTAEPQVLLTITSRFGRLSWKYSSIAYAATLKHVGVLYQTLYLVATAMGLAPCGLGSGNAEDAARAFGLDWTEESSVGEFLIGSVDTQAPPVDGFVDVTDRTRTGGDALARPPVPDGGRSA